MADDPADNEEMGMDITDSDDDDHDDDLSFELPDEPDELPLPATVQLPPLPPVDPMLPVHRVLSYDALTNAFPFHRSRFLRNYRVLSVVHLENKSHQNLEGGGKVILPPSALQVLSRDSSALLRPMMFRASNGTKFTHCGVLEFIAEEDICYMPRWMMDILEVSDHDVIEIERTELPDARFAKFQPQSVDFLEISNPKAILENCLRTFACLTKGDVIAIPYNSRVYQLRVMEIRPGDAVSIIECDLDVDFAAPVGYVSPSPSRSTQGEADDSSENAAFVPFLGCGNRLNGKEIAPQSGEKGKQANGVARGAPDTTWKIGSLQFTRKFRKLGSCPKDKNGAEFIAFGGAGLSLKTSKKRPLDSD